MSDNKETEIQDNRENPDLVYDKKSAQRFSFTSSDKENRYEWEFEVKGVSDEMLLEYDRLQEVIITDDEEDRVLGVDSMTASKELFDNHVQLVGGFEGELPTDWQKEFDDDFKQSVVAELLGADVLVDDTPKVTKKFVFGSKGKGFEVDVVANYNGTQVVVNFEFEGSKDPKHIHRYRKITGSAKFKKGREGTFIPPNWSELLSLYRDSKVTCTNANPAVHLKVIALRERFDTTVKSDTKKLKR